MKLNYKFGEGIDFDGEATELIAAVSQFEGLKSLAQTGPDGYIGFVREAIELGHHYQNPELTKMILNSREPIAALPPASQHQQQHQSQYYPQPMHMPPPQQQPEYYHQPLPQQPVYSQPPVQPTYYANPTVEVDPYANPQFNPVGTTINTEAHTLIPTRSDLTVLQAPKPNLTQSLASTYQKLNNSLEWALLKCPRIFPIYMGVLVIILIAGVLTSPLRKQLTPTPAPTPPTQPAQPKPKPTPAAPAPAPKGGTGTPPVEPPSL